MNRVVALALLLVLPVFAGCLADDPAPASKEDLVARSAVEAGAKSGEAPVAPREAYAVEETTAYPLGIQTNAARAPVVVDFSGSFAPQDCRPLRFGEAEAVLGAASYPRRFLDIGDKVQVGDAFRYHIVVSYTNAADNWAEIHPAYGFGSTIQDHSESTQDMTDVVIEWQGQGFRASEDDQAWLFIGCNLAAMKTAIAYTYTLTLTFAEGAIPAEAPVLIQVPEGATKLFVRGLPIDPALGVQSHFRLFGPDDELVCECALGSSDEVATVPLAAPGAYVLLVDHTENGFVSAALDVAPAAPAQPLAAEWNVIPVFSAAGGSVDETVDLDVGRVPLFMAAGVIGTGGAGVGKKTSLEVTNGRGTPLHVAWGGHVTWDTPDGRAWLGIWPADWAWEIDHHAFAPGAHSASVSAEELRGDVVLYVRQYVRG